MCSPTSNYLLRNVYPAAAKLLDKGAGRHLGLHTPRSARRPPFCHHLRYNGCAPAGAALHGRETSVLVEIIDDLNKGFRIPTVLLPQPL